MNHSQNAFTSSDEVRHCLDRWVVNTFAGYRSDEEIAVATTIEPLSDLLLKTWRCLHTQRSGPPRTLTAEEMNQTIPDERKCIFELAASSKDQKLCQLIDNPYKSNVWSKPNYLEAVQKAKKQTRMNNKQHL